MMCDTTANSKYVYGALLGAGYSQAAAAGVVGNLIAESGVCPTSKGDSGQALGIAQWHPDRRAACQNCWAGTEQEQLTAQTDLLLGELNGSESSAGAAIKGATDEAAAAAAFARLYERCAACSNPNSGDVRNRILNAAHVIYEANSGKWGPLNTGFQGTPSISSIPNPLDIVGEIVQPVKDIAHGVSTLEHTLTSRKFWVRVGEFLLGVLLFLMGLRFIFSESIQKAEQTIGPAVAAGAAAA